MSATLREFRRNDVMTRRNQNKIRNTEQPLTDDAVLPSDLCNRDDVTTSWSHSCIGYTESKWLPRINGIIKTTNENIETGKARQILDSARGKQKFAVRGKWSMRRKTPKMLKLEQYGTASQSGK